MNPIDQVNAFRTANPAARVWVEEVLLRGAPDLPSNFGSIQGAHFVLGIESTDLFGQTTRVLTPPFPAALVPDNNLTAFGELLGINMIMQQRSIETLQQQVKDLTAAAAAKDNQITTLTAAVAERDAQVASLTATAVAKDEQIASLIAQLQQLEAAPNV